ncbi:MAG: hypothetical protein ABSH53_06530 [Holophaga sp.]|jgi:hypothetical protein
MNNDSVINDLNAWKDNLDILLQHLASDDEDGAREAVFIMLIQGLGLFGGPEEEPMGHLFPVLDSIKGKIEKSNLDAALRQALLFRQQLEEVKVLIQDEAEAAGHPTLIPPPL